MCPPLRPATAPDTISGLLGHDHHRIDVILADVVRMVTDGEMERAIDTFDEFAADLRRHIALEEEILFPLFETRRESGGRPTAIMQAEHRRLEDLARSIGEALERCDIHEFRLGYSALRELLPRHNLKEERFLYPAIDEVLTDSERTALVHRLRQKGNGPWT